MTLYPDTCKGCPEYNTFSELKSIKKRIDCVLVRLRIVSSIYNHCPCSTCLIKVKCNHICKQFSKFSNKMLKQRDKGIKRIFGS